MNESGLNKRLLKQKKREKEKRKRNLKQGGEVCY